MPEPRKYRVTAPTRVFGVEPGQTFTRVIDPVQEERLLKSGAIKKVGGRKPAVTESTPKPEPSSDEEKE